MPAQNSDSHVALSVYDGDDRVGELVDRGPGRVEAFALCGKRTSLGIYPNRLAAMRAISASSTDVGGVVHAMEPEV